MQWGGSFFDILVYEPTCKWSCINLSIGPFLATYDSPSANLVDPNATLTTRNVWTTIKLLNTGSLPGAPVAIGQHLDAVNFQSRKPVSVLEAEVYNGVPAATPAVIGSEMDAFLAYLNKPNNQGKDVINTNIKNLTADAVAGRLVTMQWHARSPITGAPAKDRTGIDTLVDILDESTPTGAAWLFSTNQAISILQRLAAKNVTVAWRPFHEANISSFWWGKCDPALYRAMWAQMQARFNAAGLHNIIWVYAANNRDRAAVLDPMVYVPDEYDIFGLDTYQYWTPSTTFAQVPINSDDYAAIIATGKPFALTEVDVMNETSGLVWPPSVVTNSINTKVPNCAFAVFWWTYLGVDQGVKEDKQSINDLLNHGVWWANSTDGTMATTRLAQPTNVHITDGLLTWAYVNNTAKFQYRTAGTTTSTDVDVAGRHATLPPGSTTAQLRAVSPAGTAFSAWVNVTGTPG